MTFKQKMLIAHSDRRCSTALRQWFRERGYNVATVDSGISCINALRQKVPDVLVLDQGLLWGGANGVLEVMQSDPKLRQIPVLVLQRSASTRTPGATRHLFDNVAVGANATCIRSA